MSPRLALHSWTLDTTPLEAVLAIARRTGWDAIELRRLDFTRARERGQTAETVLALVRESGLAVTAVGVERGWMLAEGAARDPLLAAFAESCQWAAALGCPLVMSPVDQGRGAVERAAASLREVGDLAAEHGLRVALEFNSQAEQWRSLARIRELLALAAHPAIGLLLDTYHMERSGDGLTGWAEVPLSEVVYVQYSDVPRDGLRPGVTTDRLPPGRGVVPFREIFQLLAERGYDGDLSYEAPNPDAWARPAEEVAREARLATTALLKGDPR